MRSVRSAVNTALVSSAPRRCLANSFPRLDIGRSCSVNASTSRVLSRTRPVHCNRHSSHVRLPRRSYASEESSSEPLPGVARVEAGLLVTFPDGQRSTFSNEFLLDHCRCEECFHPSTKQRLKCLSDFDPQTAIKELQINDGVVKITWDTPEPHSSYFPFTVLARASYDPKLNPTKGIPRTVNQGPALWGSKIAEDPPAVQYDSLMPTSADETLTEKAMLDCLTKVQLYGFCFVHGVPATPEDTEELIKRIAPIRHTHYGGFWDFTADMSQGDLAYSSQSLPAHTDTTYFQDPVGLQIFHLLSHPPPGTGGATLLVDGFNAVKKLKESDPPAYLTLLRTEIPYHASGNKDVLFRPANAPVIKNGISGPGKKALVQVRWNNEDRGSLGQGMKKRAVLEWYRAARVFERIIRDKESEYWLPMKPGTMLIINNWRVMHGRSSFTGARRMCGAYVGTDEWRSRLAVLSRSSSANPLSDTWASGW